MTPPPVARICVALLVALAAGVARAEAPTIYKWVDENGVAHYTTDRDRIPSEIRSRIERPATPAASAPATPTPHAEDEMRDAVHVAPRAKAVVPTPVPTMPDTAAPAPAAAPTSAPAPPEPEAVATSPAPEATVPAESIPPPMAAPSGDEPAPPTDAVSAPPPAPVAPLTPKQSAELAKIDTEIEKLEGEISDREEKLATLLSRSDQERAAPLIDDPKFREISQRLPKLQAELQTLRERRNKIQPTATP